jgi:hypothetical protein
MDGTLASTEKLADIRLGEIGTNLKAAHSRFKLHRAEAVGAAIEEGRLLLEAKELTGHGRFMPWVQDNYPGGHDTARNRMRLVQAINEGRLEIPKISEFGLSWAMEQINKREPSEPAKAQRREDGAETTRDDAKGQVGRKAKPASAEQATAMHLNSTEAVDFLKAKLGDDYWEYQEFLRLCDPQDFYDTALAEVRLRIFH